jgi:hypothetical protein
MVYKEPKEFSRKVAINPVAQDGGFSIPLSDYALRIHRLALPR